MFGELEEYQKANTDFPKISTFRKLYMRIRSPLQYKLSKEEEKAGVKDMAFKIPYTIPPANFENYQSSSQKAEKGRKEKW